MPTAEDVSAFGQHRQFPPHARKTSGTQGNPSRHPMTKKQNKNKTTSTTMAATYEADLETLLAEPNTPYLIQNLVTWRERERVRII